MELLLFGYQAGTVAFNQFQNKCKFCEINMNIYLTVGTQAFRGLKGIPVEAIDTCCSRAMPVVVKLTLHYDLIGCFCLL